MGLTDPMVDIRLLREPAQWPIQLTAFLFGISILGAQIPLSTFLRSDPDVAGYGFGLTASETATRIGSTSSADDRRAHLPVARAEAGGHPGRWSPRAS